MWCDVLVFLDATIFCNKFARWLQKILWLKCLGKSWKGRFVQNGASCRRLCWCDIASLNTPDDGLFFFGKHIYRLRTPLIIVRPRRTNDVRQTFTKECAHTDWEFGETVVGQIMVNGRRPRLVHGPLAGPVRWWPCQLLRVKCNYDWILKDERCNYFIWELLSRVDSSVPVDEWLHAAF